MNSKIFMHDFLSFAMTYGESIRFGNARINRTDRIYSHRKPFKTLNSWVEYHVRPSPKGTSGLEGRPFPFLFGSFNHHLILQLRKRHKNRMRGDFIDYLKRTYQ